MNPGQIIADYYGREDIQEAMISFSKDREVVGVYNSGSFSTRPNVIIYPKEIMAMVKTGVIEFHSSVERWRQPMSLRYDNYDSLRKGWDLILDMDCEAFEHGKLASEVVIWALRRHGVHNVSIKFTGGTGFHIGIPWESIPNNVDYKQTVTQYPEMARTVARYLKHYLRERMEKAFFDKYKLEEHSNLESLSKQINIPIERIQTKEGIDPYLIADIDPILISPRHLFRMPYSLNKKSFLVSLPIKPFGLNEFQKEMAMPEKIRTDIGFLKNSEPGEADMLIAKSVEWWSRQTREEKEKIIDKEIESLKMRGFDTKYIDRKEIEKYKTSRTREKGDIEGELTEEFFPPCIKKINEGLPDGRKRSMFIMVNFLRTMNWTWEKINKYVDDWNSKNMPPLQENYVRSQMRWHSARKEKLPPPNCEAPGRYIDIGICIPDHTCGGEARTIKNPINYSKRLYAKQKPRREEKPRKPRKRKDPMDFPTAKP